MKNLKSFSKGVSGRCIYEILCNIEYPPETHIQLKSREISLANNLLHNNPVVLKFGTEHGSITAVLCAKFQNDWRTETNLMDKRGFARFHDGYPILHKAPGRNAPNRMSCVIWRHCVSERLTETLTSPSRCRRYVNPWITPSPWRSWGRRLSMNMWDRNLAAGGQTPSIWINQVRG